ncbi:MAG: glycosyltransferase family 4 protein [Patescibacteria group bacterium]
MPPNLTLVKTRKVKKKPLRVGFDFDGVIMYNPARIIRPVVSFFKRKRILVHRKELDFFIPKIPLHQAFFWLLHQSSLFPALNLKEIQDLVESGEIEAYVITGRFSFLKPDFERWMKKINAKKIFKGCYSNELDEQPHLFKARKINELKLDVFIEDNWDIVNYLHRKFWIKESNNKVRVLWIYNLLDRNIRFDHRFPQLRDVLKHLRQDILHVEKPKVLVISDYFYPHWTGLSKSIFHLCTALTKKYEIEVLTVKHQSKLKKREQVNDFWIQRSRPLLEFSRVFYSPGIIARTWKKARQVDTVFINSPCTNILPCTLIAKLLGKKVVIFHQGDLNLPAGFMNRILELVFNLMTLTAFGLADRLSTYTKDYAQHSRVMRYYLYKTVPTILPIPTKIDAKILAKPKTNHLTFGFAGRFVEEKGFDILFQAIPEIVEQLPGARFVFAGQTKMQYEKFYEKHLNEIKKVKRHIDFLGLLNEEELSKFYRSLDFFLLPSRSECLGLVQAEAMLQGTPVICSDIPGSRQLVKKTKFGSLFESENASDLADTIIQAVAQREMIMKNKLQASKLLDYDTLVKQSEKLIQF